MLRARSFGTAAAVAATKASNSRQGYVLGGAAVVTAGAVYLSNDERRANVKLKLDSVYRVASLISTVAVMSMSYANFYYLANPLNRGGNSIYSLLENELRELQNNQENWTIELMTIQTRIRKSRDMPKAELKVLESRIEELKGKIATTRDRINTITEEMAILMGSGDDCTEISALHRINAKRLRDMCAKNGGLYIKLGQHLAMLDHIVPPEYQSELTHLLGNTPTSSIDAVRRSEYGAFVFMYIHSFHTYKIPPSHTIPYTPPLPYYHPSLLLTYRYH